MDEFIVTETMNMNNRLRTGMYIIKVKGVAKIPDYVQLRDDEFTLLAYFRVDRPEKSLDKVGLSDKAEYIMNKVKELPFGQILKLDF